MGSNPGADCIAWSNQDDNSEINKLRSLEIQPELEANKKQVDEKRTKELVDKNINCESQKPREKFMPKF